jgi:hypothetical protein
MKLKEYKKTYEEFTGKLSDINRQIAFAGIAIIWIFVQRGNFEIASGLMIPLIFLAIALAADLFHYIYQSAAWAFFFNYHEKRIQKEKGDYEQDIKAPRKINYFSWTLFITKITCVILGYLFLIILLSRELPHN